MGGVCIALYGFIAVSGLKMIQKVDLEDNRNLFVVSVILIVGIGGLTISFGKGTLTSSASSPMLSSLARVARLKPPQRKQRNNLNHQGFIKGCVAYRRSLFCNFHNFFGNTPCNFRQ